MPKYMDRNGEEQLLRAVKKAVQLVDDEHMHPNAAVAKAAQAEDLTSEMTRRVAEAYNTGRTAYQRETSSGILDKLATFELADPDKVLAEIYSGVPKKASNTDVSDCYTKAPTGPKFDEVRLEKKVASYVDSLMAPIKTTKTASEKRRVEPELSIHDARTYMENASAKVSQAKYAFAQKLSALSNYFVTKFSYDRQPLGLVAYNVGVMHGERGNALMDHVESMTGITRTKEAANSVNRTWKVCRTAEPYSIVQDCLDAADKVAELSEEYDAKCAIFAKVAGDLYGKMAQPIKPIELKCEKTSVLRNSLFNKEALLGNVLGGAVGGTAATGTFGGDPKDLVDAGVNSLSDPKHDNALRAIRSRALLANLMTNDDVLSGYPSEDVIGAYNTLSQLSPRGAQQPAAVQAFLRNYMSQGGHVPMFEAMEAANLEKTLLEGEHHTSGGHK